MTVITQNFGISYHERSFEKYPCICGYTTYGKEWRSEAMGRKCLRKSFQMGRLLWRGKFTCSKLLCFYMNTRILISSCLWSIGQQMRRWRHHKKILLFYYIKKWRVCTVKDHRRRQNVVKASVILDQLYLLSFFLFFFLPHFVVICHLLLNRCAASLNPFVNVIRFELSLSS